MVEDIRKYENKMELLDLLSSIIRGIDAADRGERVSQAEAMKRLDALVDE